MKKRLDILLVERGLAESRARAQAYIMEGRVRAGDRVYSKPGEAVDETAPLTLEQPETSYVGRGGEKLAHALDRFGLDPAGLVALDVGASTGGFTDVLLRRGAARVYAVDVGYGELAWSLREDPRVVVMERTNIRYLERLPEQPALAVIDVSFISLDKVLPAVWRLLASDGRVVALIKPQFEAGRGLVGKGGVVRDPATHRLVLERALAYADAAGWRLGGLVSSPILGRAGNREFLVLWGTTSPPLPLRVCEKSTGTAGSAGARTGETPALPGQFTDPALPLDPQAAIDAVMAE